MEAQIEEAIKFRKKANFKILTRLSQIIDQYPYLRFHQILIIYIRLVSWEWISSMRRV